MSHATRIAADRPVQLRLALPADLAARLSAEAAARHLTESELVEMVLDGRLTVGRAPAPALRRAA